MATPSGTVSGAPVAAKGLRRVAGLAVVVGRGGPQLVGALLAALGAQPRLFARVAAVVRIADRRWDIRFANGIVARLPEAKVRGFSTGRFSFNRAGGRCEACEGLGSRCVEMHFLPDVWVRCEACEGRRYNADVLSVKFRGYTIPEIGRASLRARG